MVRLLVGGQKSDQHRANAHRGQHRNPEDGIARRWHVCDGQPADAVEKYGQRNRHEDWHLQPHPQQPHKKPVAEKCINRDDIRHIDRTPNGQCGQRERHRQHHDGCLVLGIFKIRNRHAHRRDSDNQRDVRNAPFQQRVSGQLSGRCQQLMP